MNRFLVIQTASAGDVILATPVVEKLHQHFPDAKIDILVKKGNESLFDNHPFLNAVLVFNKKENKIVQLFGLIKRVRKEKYSAVVNMHRFFSSGLITACSKAERRIGFNKNPLSMFFSSVVMHKIGDSTNIIHEIDRNLMLIEHFTDTSRVLPKLYPPRVNVAKLGITADFVTISPASLWFTKQWPVDRWVKLIFSLEKNYKVVLLGGVDDVALCNDIILQLKSTSLLNLAGKLTFLESAGLMSRAVMNYTNDSAPMHLASAVNAPVSAVFCSTVPEFGFGPLSEKSIILQTKEKLVCRPCGLHGHRECPEKHFRCAQIEIMPDTFL